MSARSRGGGESALLGEFEGGAREGHVRGALTIGDRRQGRVDGGKGRARRRSGEVPRRSSLPAVAKGLVDEGTKVVEGETGRLRQHLHVAEQGDEVVRRDR